MANINKISLLIFIIGAFLIGCSNVSNVEPESGRPLVSAEKGKYALLVVDEKSADYYREWLDEKKIDNVKVINGRTSLEDTNKEYRFLELKRTPAFVVFNTKDMVYKTYSEEELIKFLRNSSPN